MSNASVETVLGGHAQLKLTPYVKFLLDLFEADFAPPRLDDEQQAVLGDFFDKHCVEEALSGARAKDGAATTTRDLAKQALIEVNLPGNVSPDELEIFVGPYMEGASGVYVPSAIML